MNKTSVVRNVSEMSGVDSLICVKVLDALERILNTELASSKGIGNAFDKIYKVMSLFRNNKQTTPENI